VHFESTEGRSTHMIGTPSPSGTFAGASQLPLGYGIYQLRVLSDEVRYTVATGQIMTLGLLGIIGSLATLHSTITNSTRLATPMTSMLMIMGEFHGKYAPPVRQFGQYHTSTNERYAGGICGLRRTSGNGNEQKDDAQGRRQGP
jgi:hypothetical protein